LTCELIVLTLSYLAAVVAAHTLFYASIPFDVRIISPLSITFVGIAATQVVTLRRGSTRPWVGVAVGVGVAVVLVAASTRTATVASTASRSGLGFTGPKWEVSETMAYQAAQPPDAIIYTNGRNVTYHYLGRTPRSLPRSTGEDAVTPNPTYREELSRLQHDVLHEGAQVVLFDTIERTYFPTTDELRDDYGLAVVETLDDGLVLGPPPGGP
jgi:hypothetical protein